MDRIARTIELHRELMALWNIEDAYNVMVSIHPGDPAYSSIDLPEVMGGTDQDIPLKRLEIAGNRYDATHITIYAPRGK